MRCHCVSTAVCDWSVPTTAGRLPVSVQRGLAAPSGLPPHLCLWDLRWVGQQESSPKSSGWLVAVSVPAWPWSQLRCREPSS